MSANRTIWIDRGQPVPGLNHNPFRDFDLPFRYYSLIEISLTEEGTVVRWDPSCVHECSVQAVIDLLPDWTGSCTLKFFKQGWFTETLASPVQAARRISHIQSLRNVEPIKTSHVRNVPVGACTLLPSLRSAFANPDAFRPYAVEDVIDDNEGTFDVDHIGRHSTFRKYVCRMQDDELNIVPGNEQWINEIAPTYVDALKSWKPKLDHVIARLSFADDEPVWLTWHRLVHPIRRPNGRFGVRSFVVPAPVDVSVI